MVDEVGYFGLTDGVACDGLGWGEEDGDVVLADARDERLDDAFGVEAEILQACADGRVGLADVGGAPLVFRPRRMGGDNDRVISREQPIRLV